MSNEAEKRKTQLEPQIHPVTKMMDVGGLTIPPTSMLTALLYGFAHHPKVYAREFYFWRLCDELWNHPDLPEPMMVRHPWATQMIREALENKYFAVGGSASSGKCLAPDTLVRMAYGGSHRADAIKVGDRLIGDDGKYRTVTGVNRGRSNMVRIVPTVGENWCCNDDHILTVFHNGKKETFDISVKDYLSKGQHTREKLKLIKGVAPMFRNNVPLSARVYGYWIGMYAYHNKSSEIIKNMSADEEARLFLDTFKSEGIEVKPNQVKKLARLIKEGREEGPKRIDHRYLWNDETRRLELLSGIVEANGEHGVRENSRVLKFEHEQTRDDVKELADSLGFFCCKNNEASDPRRPYGVSIRCRRTKKGVERSMTHTGFKVEEIGEGDWAGFAVDGNHRFLLADGTITHNSHTMAAYGILSWLSQPADTMVLMTSTTLREARKRIWGSVMSLLSVIDGAPIKIRDSIGNASYVNAKGTLIERAGLSLIAAEKSKTKDAIGKFIGLKQKRVILIGDELSELSEAILQAGLSNLSKNPFFQMIGMSNPNSRFDAFGVWSEPKGGWDSVDTQNADGWDTKWGGRYLRLDGEKSPNIILGENKYPWLPTQEKLDEDRSLLGPESRGYMRMVRAVFFDSDETTGIYNESELAQSGAMSTVGWSGKPVTVVGIDPAFTNGGDRTIMSVADVGYATNGQYVIQFKECIHLNDDASNKAVPRTYQIVHQIIDNCKRLGIAPHNVAIDSTGAGAPFCDVLAGEWDPSFLRVVFNGKASDKRVSSNSRMTGEQLYVNRVSEMWFVGKELLRTGQIKGVQSDLAQEMCARNYEMVKTGSLKVKIESKMDFKSRFGRSPDLADAAFLALDCARQRLGLVSIDPPKDEMVNGVIRPRVTINSLRNALHNPDTSLV